MGQEGMVEASIGLLGYAGFDFKAIFVSRFLLKQGPNKHKQRKRKKPSSVET